MRHVPGGVDEYLKLLDEQATQAKKKTSAPAPHKQNNKPAGAERRDIKRKHDAIGRKLQKLDGEPDRIRKEMQTCDPSDFATLQQLTEQLAQTEQQISSLEDEWLALDEQLESYDG